jgi:uncharacterized protein (DUF362 family)
MKVSIVDCEAYEPEQVYKAIKESLAKIDFRIPENKKVLLKPNILGQNPPKDCVTTNPIFVEAASKIFLEKGNKVIIGESSGFHLDGGTSRAFEISGIKQVADKHNIQLENFEKHKVRHIHDEKAAIYKNLEISGLIFDVDLIVSLPKLKTHTLVKYTGAIKNLFGTVPGGRKQKLHGIAQKESDFAQVLVDVYQNVRPSLSIMDGIVGLEGNGPGSSGIPKKTGIILASQNAAALDIVASEIIGYDPMKVYTNKYSIERGLINPNEIEIIGNKRIINYKKPITAPTIASPIVGWVMKQGAMKPYCIKKNCKKCQICMKVCPVNAIKMAPYPVIDKKKCISCYCCHENCQYKAMGLKGSWIFETARKAKNTLLKKLNK